MQLQNEEVIKEITGYEGYFVSNKGRLFSNRPINGRGNILDVMRELKQSACSNGNYLRVRFLGKDFMTHRLVAREFIGICPNDHEVSHKDGNSFNNSLENLEYITHSENELRKRNHGTSKCGERHHGCKLTNDQVIYIRETLYSGNRGVATLLAKEFNVSNTTISHIKNNIKWNHI